MTTNAMTCTLFSDRLMAYLEHETDDATRAALERHAVTCAECGALLADLRKLRIDASNLPELTPSRDLWSGIAARIEAPVVPIGTVRQVEGQRRVVARRWMNAALIAASLVAAAGVGYLAARGRQSDVPGIGPVAQQQPETLPAALVATDVGGTGGTEGTRRTPSSVVADAGTPTRKQPRADGTPAVSVQPLAAQLAVATLSADYDREIARLRTLIDRRRNQLDPITVAIIEKNLQVIDTAIVECKKAIARDPASRFLIESLNQSLQTKVELMRTAALLPTRT
jgi:anti-sigma factor RsiW